MATRAHRLPPDEAPVTFAPEAADPWEAWFDAVLQATRQNKAPPASGAPRQSQNRCEPRILRRWLVLVDALPEQTSVAWWHSTLAAAGAWCPTENEWPVDAVLADPSGRRARFLAAWLQTVSGATASERIGGLRWPRSPLTATAVPSEEAWAHEILETLWKELRQHVRLPALSDELKAPVRRQVERQRWVLSCWMEAAAALEDLLEAKGQDPMTAWRLRFRQDARMASSLSDVRPGNVGLERTWQASGPDGPVWRTVGQSPKAAWCGTVEVLIRAGSLVVPLWRTRNDGVRIDHWWQALLASMAERRGNEHAFPSPDAAWNEWHESAGRTPDLDAQVLDWRLQLSLVAAPRPTLPVRRRI